jgi:hypothetical protein
MTRKVILSKDTTLWEEGDAARNIAIVDGGKLAVRVNGQLVGLVWPKMVIGESAILAAEGEVSGDKRTASVYAWEDKTEVSEYPASLVRRTFEEGSRTVTMAVLTSLVGQICRNCLMIMTAQQNRPMINVPFKGLMDGLLASFRDEAAKISRWEDFMASFKVLHALRDTTEQLREGLVMSHEPEAITQASNFFRDVYKSGPGAQLEVEDYLRAERERHSWLSAVKSEAGSRM